MRTENLDVHVELAEQVLPASIRLCPGPEGQKPSMLSGGIINLNQKVYLAPDAKPAVLSLYLSGGKERVERELFVRSLIGKNSPIPIQNVIFSGMSDETEGKDIGYLIKDYKPGQTLSEVLLHPEIFTLENSDIKSLLGDLGRYLGLLNSTHLPKFGKIEGTGIVGPLGNGSWKDYYLFRLGKRITALRTLNPDKKVGDLRVKDVLVLLPHIVEGVGKRSKILDEVDAPYFIHNDFHFLNILANKSQDGWYISGILDLESATAGDPDFDLISIESQLNLTPEYRERFMSNVEHFRLAYGRQVSKDYQQKRWLYHSTWSLSYFEAVMQMNINEHPINEQIRNYMERHYEMLNGLANGKNPEEIGAPSLY